MSRARIHQFHSGSAVGDAVTNGMFMIKSILDDIDINSDIYVEHRDPRLEGELLLLGQLNPNPDDILIVHHSMGHDVMPVLTGVTCRKILVYHNITPPEFFSPTSPFRKYSIKGYEQLHELKPFVEGSIADSEYNAIHLRERGFDNVSVIPLLRDFERTRHAPYTKHFHYLDKPSLRLLFVGRIIKNKCQAELIEFIGRYRDRFPYPVHLTLAGHFEHGESYVDDLRALIARHRLQDCVTLTGRVSDADLYGLYRAADVYVSLSDHEGFGVPLLEAMAFDVPVVARSSSAVGYTLGGAGVLMSDRSFDSLFDALNTLASDPVARRRVIQGQRRRLQDFSRPRLALQFYEFLLPYASDEMRSVLAAAARREPVAASGKRTHFIVEGPCESSYSLALVNRHMADVLDRLPNASASVVPADGTEGYRFNEEQAKALPWLEPLLRDHPSDADLLVSIRNMYPQRPAGMLGDLRFILMYWEETAIDHNLAMMINRHTDGMLAPSSFCKNVLRNSGVAVPIAIVGNGMDDLRRHVPAGAGRPRVRQPTAENPFIFLHVSSGLARKGIEELYNAYFTAFRRDDPVLLVIKTHPNETNVVWKFNGQFSSAYPNGPAVQIISQDITAKEMADLYRHADAVVLPTRGEGFNLPAAEALSLGVPLITTRHSAHLDFCTDENCLLIDCKLEPSQSHLGIPGSLWARADVGHLARAMRQYVKECGNPESAMFRRAQAGLRLNDLISWDNMASKISVFAETVMSEKQTVPKLKLGWVSTYNGRCGIADYSRFLVEALWSSHFDVTILANNLEPAGPDPDNMVRCWTDLHGSLDEMVQRAIASGLHAVMFQFNYGFFELQDFAQAIRRLTKAGIQCHVCLHKSEPTVIDGRDVSLGDITDALSLCSRILVHNVNDVNRLRGYGLSDNVVLFPHGTVNMPLTSKTVVRQMVGLGDHGPIIASYGFLLPGKGLPELIEAFALLINQHPRAMLLMVNADYPNIVSQQEREVCQELIRNLGLENNILLVNDYLEYEQSLLLVQAADVVAYAYQHTGESASGAVRMGLISRRPIACTPLPIFDDLKDCVYQMPGITPADMAKGLSTLLSNPELQRELINRQANWVESNSWERLGERLSGMLIGCFEDETGMSVRPLPKTVTATKAVAGLNGRFDDLAALPTEAFIRVVCQRIQNRPAEGGDYEKYGGALNSGAMTRAEVVHDLRMSVAPTDVQPDISSVFMGPAKPNHSIKIDTERLMALDDEHFVEAVYQVLLGRPSDEGGRNNYLQALRNGAITKRTLIDDVINSEEFRVRNKPIMLV